MEPEIARRCLSCGASVRGAARFCPQCGQAMTDVRDASPRAQSQPALVEEAERVASSLESRLTSGASGDEGRRAQIDARAEPSHDENGARPAQDATTEPRVASGGSVESQPLAARSAEARPAADQNPTAPAAPSATSYSDAAQSSGTARTSRADAHDLRDVRATGEASSGGVRGRAASAGAGVGESLRPRVDRLRERSVVVLDEAADDPGLRFVLVAATLFVVALLLYVFSFVLR